MSFLASQFKMLGKDMTFFVRWDSHPLCYMRVQAWRMGKELGRKFKVEPVSGGCRVWRREDFERQKMVERRSRKNEKRYRNCKTKHRRLKLSPGVPRIKV